MIKTITSKLLLLALGFGIGWGLSNMLSTLGSSKLSRGFDFVILVGAPILLLIGFLYQDKKKSNSLDDTSN